MSSPLRAILLLSISSQRRGTPPPPPFLQVQGAWEETARPRGGVLEESRNVALVVLHVLELFKFNICMV